MPRSAGATWCNGRFSEIDAAALPNVQIAYHDVNRHGVVVGERMTDYRSFHMGLQTGALSVNRLGTIGAGGAVIHANGRVASVHESALVHVVTDGGIAVGTTDFPNGQAVRWLGC